MQFTRENPSPAYWQLIDMYREMHEKGYLFKANGEERWIEPGDTFQGLHSKDYLKHVKYLVEKHHSKTLLDYGSGKAEQHNNNPIVDPVTKESFPNTQAFWGIDEIHCFDPGAMVGNEIDLPIVDGVYSTDVLEHVFIGDLPWIIDEMFRHARHFVFCNVACYPAGAHLPNGDNAHITQCHPRWWHGLFFAIGNNHPNIDWAITCDHNMSGQGMKQEVFVKQWFAGAKPKQEAQEPDEQAG